MRATFLTCAAVLSAALPLSGDEKKEPPKVEPVVQLEIKGEVLTGILAIGGETTGVVIRTDKGMGFGCELAGVKDESVNKKTCIVTGTFALKDGVEIKQR